MGRQRPEDALQRKRCSMCGTVKVAAEFHRQTAALDGLQSRCKSCIQTVEIGRRDYHREKAAVARRNNPEIQRARGRRHNARRWHNAAYREEHRARQRTAKAIERVRLWHAQHRLELATHRMVSRALKRGILVRPDGCEGCKRSHCRIEAHHDDYQRPLAVRWLCKSCHGLHHAAIRRGATA